MLQRDRENLLKTSLCHSWLQSKQGISWAKRFISQW